MKTVVRVFAQALAIALLWSAAVGHAQPAASNKARARDLYAHGQQLFRQGDFSAAQRAFEDAYRAVPNPVVLLSVAECQVRSEDFGGALSSLEQYLTERTTAPDRIQVEAQMANLRAKPGFVAIESTPTGAMIYVDGQNTGYITPNELSLRAGAHTIALVSTGYVRAEHQVQVALGGRQRVTLTLVPEPKAEPQPVAEETTQEVTSPVRGKRHGTVGSWVAFSLTGVATVTGTGLGIGALRKQSAYKDKLGQEPQVVDRNIRKQGERMALFSDVSFGVAAVAGVTALVLYLTSTEPVEQGEQAWLIAPELSPQQLGLSGRVRF